MTEPIENGPAQSGESNIGRAVHDAFEHLTLLYANSALIQGSLTNLKDLDAVITTKWSASLMLVVSRPSLGRTAFAGHLAFQTRVPGAVVVYSIDLPSQKLVMRAMASRSSVDLSRLLAGKVNERDWEKLAHSAGEIAQLSLELVEASSFTVDQLIADTLERQRQAPAGMIIVDGLELLSLRSGQEIDDALLKLRRLSRVLSCPVVVTLPLGQAIERRAHKRPMLTDIEISSVAEGAADVIIGLYRDDVYDRHSASPEIAELIVLKQKDGPVGTVKVRFQPQFMSFSDLPNTSSTTL